MSDGVERPGRFDDETFCKTPHFLAVLRGFQILNGRLPVDASKHEGRQQSCCSRLQGHRIFPCRTCKVRIIECIEAGEKTWRGVRPPHALQQQMREPKRAIE